MNQKTRANRGTFRRGYNQIIKCVCCGFNTQSQIGSGTDLCRECYDFQSEYNTWTDGESKATELPQPKRCPNCKQQREEAIAEDAKNAEDEAEATMSNYNVQIALGPERHEGETLAQYLNRNSKKPVGVWDERAKTFILPSGTVKQQGAITLRQT